ncbi:hypothetical protein E2I00_005486 [Balaenoptera physalus]|uniref:MHC class II beta chain N-terminal domain-containing protein n=1 Tax=Balaenoptera physalus TaxID=9770 RepID=A0A643BNJ8_BALPH|nr:hypothetical protein E2I00_005486 [Balaenoptera physalus]
MEQVWFLARYTYNAQEDVHLDSDAGEFTAVTELGRPDTESWNQQKDFMEQKRAKVDTGHSLNVSQSKMLSGTGGFVLGLLFLGVGLFIYFRNQKGKEPVGS